jgi:hypothetical protein
MEQLLNLELENCVSLVEFENNNFPKLVSLNLDTTGLKLFNGYNFTILKDLSIEDVPSLYSFNNNLLPKLS